MVPYLVTPPAALPVSLADMKAHLRVDHNDEDELIDATQEAAVAYLDGRGGILGRCIIPQVWAVDVAGPGPHLLPFPDASNIAATSDGAAVSSDAVLTATGWRVTLDDAASDQGITISATYGLSATRLPAAQALVKLIVGNWFENREAVTERSMANLPMAADALIHALRWYSL